MNSARILVGSPSASRRQWYERILEGAGYAVDLADNAVDCERLATAHVPRAIIVEASILWGGVEGLLDVIRSDRRLKDIPVIVIGFNVGAKPLFELSRYDVFSLFLGWPAGEDLLKTLAEIPRAEDAPHSVPEETRRS